MSEEKVSRRDFLKLLLTGLAGWLVSCLPRPRSLPAAETPATAAGATPSPEPTVTPTQPPTPTATPTLTPTSTPIPCFRLLAPENGTKLPALGRVTFAWEAMPGAARYEVRFTLPTGATVSFETPNTSLTRYIESFLLGGVYAWQALAYDAAGALLCAAEPFTFEKPASAPENGDGGQSGDNNTIPPPPPPPTIGPDQ